MVAVTGVFVEQSTHLHHVLTRLATSALESAVVMHVRTLDAVTLHVLVKLFHLGRVAAT